MQKLADLLSDVKLQPHQQAIFDEAKDHPVRKLLMWQLGSGKSLGGLAAAEALKEPYTVVAPASLRETWRKERENFTDQQTPSDIISYTTAAKGSQVADKTDTLIADEAHRLRNPGSKQTKSVYQMADKSKNLLLLTGTPLVNSPGDLAPLLSMLTRRKMLPQDFEEQFVSRKQVQPGLFAKLRGIKPGMSYDINNEDQLKALLSGHIDYYSPKHDAVPTTFEDINVDMGPQQSQLYKAMLDELPWALRWKLKNDFPLSREEYLRLQSFLTGPRQVGLSTLPFLRDKNPDKAFSQSTKLQKAHSLLTERLKDDRTKALIFSNFIDAGLTPYASALEKEHIPHAIFHGGLNDAQRKKLVDDYNTNKIRVALLGPSGAEGLSFKGTQLIQILDPYWHNVRTKQQQGRGLRFDSHTALPEDLKNVTVQRFISKLPLSTVNNFLTSLGMDRSSTQTAADDILRNMSAKKDTLNEKFIELLKQEGSKNKRYETNAVDDINQIAANIKPCNPVKTDCKVRALPSALSQLEEAKQHSDKGDWNAKHSILLSMMNKHPNHWNVEQLPRHTASITHWPTKWRFHMPKEIIPSIVYRDIRSRNTTPLQVNEEKGD